MGATGVVAPPPKIIYDFGANNGDDIPYYLRKADLVVAVEANPSLCREIESRFAAEIAAGRVRVENCVLVGEGEAPEVHFYLHKRHHVLGQFPTPDPNVIADYDRILLPSRRVLDLLQKHGDPYYIKIDIEHSEEAILKELFGNGIRPPFLSAEAHSIKVFALLAGLGDYKAFKLVDGPTVAARYNDRVISASGERYSFPPHSAGPFGEDIAGDWLSADDLFELLADQGLGWKDIHATNLVPEPESRVRQSRARRRHLGGWLRGALRPSGKP